MKKHLKQIKIFFVDNYGSAPELENKINDYIVKTFKKTGNYPNVETNSKFITVIVDKLIEIDE